MLRTKAYQLPASTSSSTRQSALLLKLDSMKYSYSSRSCHAFRKPRQQNWVQFGTANEYMHKTANMGIRTSNVIGMRESPVVPPKSWLMTTLFGLIHVTKANMLRNLATGRKSATHIRSWHLST
jgi:hypothetical protein